MKLVSLIDFRGVVDGIVKKFHIGPELALRVIQYASDHGIGITKVMASVQMMKNILRIVEEVKVESVLKLSLTGQPLFAAKRMQKKLDDPDAVTLSEKDLHVTLAAGPEWKKLRNNVKTPMPDPKFKIDFTDPQKVTHGNRTSWYVKIKQQKDMDNYVKEILGTVPNPDRVYHVSLANLTGKIGDSVALVEFFTLGVNKPTMAQIQGYLDHLGTRLMSVKDTIKYIEKYYKTIKNLKLDKYGRKVLSFEEFETEERDYKDEYVKFQSSKKMKKYRAELNRYNHEKGTYGNKDGKDASHKDGKIVGFEDESANRGRAEKSRLVGSKRKPA